VDPLDCHRNFGPGRSTQVHRASNGTGGGGGGGGSGRGEEEEEEEGAGEGVGDVEEEEGEEKLDLLQSCLHGGGGG
jgi:hypothetical protein